MPGVEILTTNEIAVTYGFSLAAVIITSSIAFVLSYVFFCLLSHGLGNDTIITIMFATVCSIVITGICFWGAYECTKQPIEYETQYQVTISDSVSMNEFIEKYEILKIDGKIFTVRERGD